MSNLPPGTTPGDIDRHFGAPECGRCGVELDDDRDDDVALCPRCRQGGRP